MDLKFRLLKADEIDVRIGTTKLENSQDKFSRVIAASYLLYKDARVDMRLLDENVGNMNWQRKHEFKDGKLYCTVSIYDEEKKQWVSKEDVGVESNTEAEKGQASDAFKRACFNIGIGRELYTAPFIWIEANDNTENLKYVKMKVKHIGYDESGKITELIIVDNNNKTRYEYYGRENKSSSKQVNKPKLNQKLVDELISLGGTLERVATYYKHKSIDEVTNEEIQTLVDRKKGKS